MDSQCGKYQRLSKKPLTDDEGNPIFEAEFHEYDDKGTPEEGDDDHIYIVRHYALRDGGGLDASEGEIWLFNPNLDKVKTWDISSLECLKHEENDGLEADEQGIAHAVLVPVPVGMMNDEGEYIFVVHAKDDHAPEYRDHEKRWALELNGNKGLRPFHIEDDYMFKLDGNPIVPDTAYESAAHRRELRIAFREADWVGHIAGMTCQMQVCVDPQYCGALPHEDFRESLAEPDLFSYSKDRFHYYGVRKKERFVHVIGASAIEYDYDNQKFGYGKDHYAFVFVGTIRKQFEQPYNKVDEVNLRITVHEIGHGLFGLPHCDNRTETPQGGDNPDGNRYCVMREGGSDLIFHTRDWRFCSSCIETLKKK